MNSLFNTNDYNDIKSRIEKFQHNSTRLWGKMEPAQMLAHCNGAMKSAVGDLKFPRSFLGRLIGGMVKKSFVSEKPFSKSSPTAKQLIISDKREFDKEKAELLELVKRFHEGGEKGATTHPHSFFGELTPEQWGFTQWKHLDHHLRQFGL
jgi:hypothetical protein